MTTPRYDDAYYEGQGAQAMRSAEAIVPLVMSLLEPRSVCDVGCARGSWLAVFERHGVSEVLGIDGDYVDREHLEIAEDRFVAADLEQGIPAAGSFDLAISLEVAEHLPEAAADRFVEGLVALAPAVLFSAAVPGQGGRHHVNEQWPEYWEMLFARHDHVAIDCIRPAVWRTPGVDVWYRQNILLFAKRSLIESRVSLREAHERTGDLPLSLVHPRVLEIALRRPWELMRKLASEVEQGRLTQEELDERIARMLERLAERASERALRP
jgi:SAM-dependent methyltransferase